MKFKLGKVVNYVGISGADIYQAAGEFYRDIEVLGISGEMVLENMKFFQDFWNYFPHKILGGQCPAERYRQVYG